MSVFRKKISPFELVNQKNTFQEVLDSLNGRNWTVYGEEIRFLLTRLFFAMRREKGQA